MAPIESTVFSVSRFESYGKDLRVVESTGAFPLAQICLIFIWMLALFKTGSFTFSCNFSTSWDLRPAGVGAALWVIWDASGVNYSRLS